MDPASIFFPRQLLDRVTSWIGASVTSAFFSSLDRFSCVNVAASDGEEDYDHEDAESSTAAAGSSRADPDPQATDLPPV